MTQAQRKAAAAAAIAAKTTLETNAENGTVGNAKIVGINSASASTESSGLENANDTTTSTPEQAVNSELHQPITFTPEPVPVKPVESVEDKIERVTALHRNIEHRETYVHTVEKLRDFTYERKEQAKDYEANYYRGCTVIIRDDKGNEFKSAHPDFVQSCAKAAEEFCYQRITELNTAIIQG